MTDYLWHVTLDTGHMRRSPRDEVSPEAITVAGTHLARALETGSDPVPGFGDYVLRATADGRLLLGTILRCADGAPILTIGVAPKSRGAPDLWTMMIGQRDYPVERGQPPATPWCAVCFDLPSLLTEVASWAGDYERCLAWAWIEGRANA